MAARKDPFWAKTYITDIGNGDPNTIDPGTTKQSEGWEVEKPLLQHMNWILNLFGKFISSNNRIQIIGDSVELESGDRVRVNNSISPKSVSLPANPVDEQWVEIGATNAVTVNAVTVDGNGNDIMVAADQSCVLDLDNIVFKFYWSASNSWWVINKVGEESL